MPSCSLNWYPDRGFELDLDAGDDEVTLRMVAVPVPADGTAVLYADGVDLHKLEILFKGQAEIEGEPGQLQDARVQLVDGPELEVSVRIEDMETGELVSWSTTVPVSISPAAPARGGPKPAPPDEDELDWDDETTLEKMIGDAPLASPTPTKSKTPAKPPAGGIQRLLQALQGLEDDDDDLDLDDDSQPHLNGKAANSRTTNGKVANASPAGGLRSVTPISSRAPTSSQVPDAAPRSSPPLPISRAPASRVPTSGARTPSRMPSSLPSVAPPAAKPPVPPSAAELTATEEARRFLVFMLEKESILLEEDGTLDELIPGVARILAGPAGPERKARSLSKWLMDQPSVAELYVDDDELASILDQW